MEFGARFAFLGTSGPIDDAKLEKRLRKLKVDGDSDPVYDYADTAASDPIYDNPQTTVTLHAADTNVAAFAFVNLAGNVPIYPGAPDTCSQCLAVVNEFATFSDATHYSCGFCGQKNKARSKPDVGAVQQYIINDQDSSSDEIIIFCIDTSGSMGVTTTLIETLHESAPWPCNTCTLDNIPSATICAACGAAKAASMQKTVHLSRLESIMLAVTSQLEALEKSSPSCKVGIVTFNSQVTIFGDGQIKPRTLNEAELYDYDGLFALGQDTPFVSRSVVATRRSLHKLVFDLKENGQTALGPALLVSVGMASRANSSKVIVCTDGLSNVGLGALSPESSQLERKYSAGYFDRVGTTAQANGVCISVISIRGEECNLDQLGSLADRTGGSVSRADPTQLNRSVALVAQKAVLANRVKVSFVIHSRFSCLTTGLPVREENRFGINGKTQLVGAVTNVDEMFFQFAKANDFDVKARHAPPLPHRVPIQLQVEYSDKTGCKNLRVFNSDLPLSDDPAQTFKTANVSVLSAFVTSSTAELALHGEYHLSRLFATSYRHLLDQIRSFAAKDQQEEAVYDNFTDALSSLDEQIERGKSSLQRDDHMANELLHMKRAKSRFFKKSKKEAKTLLHQDMYEQPVRGQYETVYDNPEAFATPTTEQRFVLGGDLYDTPKA